VGDPVYGGDAVHLGVTAPLERSSARAILAAIHRQCLHARGLRLVHPATGKTMEFESLWPEDFAAAVSKAFP
jgi:23S rRNA pseudouridine1911/1915/1917 synthase